jgi:hypothetical protein
MCSHSECLQSNVKRVSPVTMVGRAFRKPFQHCRCISLNVCKIRTQTFSRIFLFSGNIYPNWVQHVPPLVWYIVLLKTIVLSNVVLSNVVSVYCHYVKTQFGRRFELVDEYAVVNVPKREWWTMLEEEIRTALFLYYKQQISDIWTLLHIPVSEIRTSPLKSFAFCVLLEDLSLLTSQYFCIRKAGLWQQSWIN